MSEPTKRIRRNVEAQERVVDAIYDFARKQQTREHDVTSTPVRDGRLCEDERLTLNGAAVGEALAEIMEAFGYAVTPIE